MPQRASVPAGDPAGSWSATTQYALCLARAILESGGVDPRAVARHLKRWADSADWRHASPALRVFLARLRRGGPWDACAVGGWRGRGAEALSAAVPIGAWLWDDAEGRRRAVEGVLKLSHRLLEPAAAARAAADALAWALRASPSDPPPVAELVREARSRPLRRRLRALESARSAARSAPGPAALAAPAAPRASQVLAAALESSDFGARNFMAAVGDTLARGRGAAEASALAGALVGARQGDQALPAHVRRVLENAQEIAHLAEALGRGAAAARRGLIPVVQSTAVLLASRAWRWVRIGAGSLLLVLGLAGLFLPFLQGFLLIVSGLAVLGAEFPWARDLLRRLRVLLRLGLRRLRSPRRS